MGLGSGTSVGMNLPLAAADRVATTSQYAYGVLNSAYLYVGANGDHTLQRVNLTTSQVERTFPLPIAGPFNLPTTVYDMHVVPGTSTSVVATLFARRRRGGHHPRPFLRSEVSAVSARTPALFFR